MTAKLAAYVLTYNEERYLEQCLSFLTSVTDDVVVMDSESSDGTAEIARSFPGVRFYQRAMPYHFAEQRNHAQSLCDAEWILTLDADELLHPQFLSILPALLEDDRYLAYSFPRLDLAGDEEHYIDKPAVVPGDWDAQIRLYRKGLTWAHEDLSGLHEGLMINGRIAEAHPAHVPPEVRYVHYPILHYQLLKSDDELRSKAPCFLTRQNPEGRIVVTDEHWWVRKKHGDNPILPLSDWTCWLSFPPENDEQRIGWLYDYERRVDELVEYTGRTRSAVQRRLRHAVRESIEEFLRVDPDDEAAVVAFYREWDGYLYELTHWHLTDPVHQGRLRAAVDAVKGSKSVLVHGDGIGDLSLELAWRGIPKIVYAELDSPSKRFLEWRRKRFHLEDRIDTVTLAGGPELSGRYDAILSLDVLEHVRRPERFLREFGRHTDRLILNFAGADGDPMRSPLHLHPGYPLTKVMAELGWRTEDNYVWDRRHRFPLKRRRVRRGQKRILSFLLHPPWMYNIAHLDHQFEILPTPAWGAWCPWVRPLRANMRMLPLDLWKVPEEARFLQLTIPPFDPSDWRCAFIQHELDIPILTRGDIPLVFMAHSFPSCPEIVELVAARRKTIAAAVFTSPRKKEAWKLDDGIVLQPTIDTSSFAGYEGDLSQCLVVCNSYAGTDDGAALRRLDRITRAVPTFICDAATMVHADCDFQRLKTYYRNRRVYVHAVQDRAVMSLMEAMCTGMPAVVWRGYSDGVLEPFEDGVNCYISDDLDYLHERVCELMADRGLCRRIGQAGRELIREKFDINPWLETWNEILHDVGC